MSGVITGIPNCPESTPNLEALVESTIAAFEILSPWCMLQSRSEAARLIKIQAHSYAKAINLTITAAQDGYNITQDVLRYVQLSPSFDETRRHEYWKNMVGYAVRGRENAVKAQNEFRNLIRNAKKDANTSCENVGCTELDALKRDIKTLEKFNDNVSAFVAWWNVLELDYNAQQTRSSSLQTNYNYYRDASVVKNWEKLKEKYVDYTCEKIQEFIDSNPEFLAILREPESEGLERKKRTPFYFRFFTYA
ncbi:hypothetical protein CVT25_000513 [Psilocybe cyanescens]|uniref:Uncharacterized protein n=1 Tax=Psilocybe cyanescens TaxID=93625 RepID=A0A409XS55_PSICY|nr:hypothetical protein CVT25_000513 [Psilocybe cyanescens]